MKIQQDIKLDFDDVLIIPKRTTLESRKQVKLEKTFYFYHSPRSLTCVPVMCSNMAFCGPKLAKKLSENGMCAALNKYLTIEEIHSVCHTSDRIFMSIGLNEQEKLMSFIQKYQYSPNLVIDVPNAYMDKFVKYCEDIRSISPDSIIIAGNVVTPEMVQELIIYGKIDCVKIGIGPGSHCETKRVTGVGYQQISAAMECSIVAHGLKNGDKKLGLICLDGGFKHIGDLAKGFVAGADFCMTSSLFCGVDESDGEWVYEKVIDPYAPWESVDLTRKQLENEFFKSFLVDRNSVINIPYNQFECPNIKFQRTIKTEKKVKFKHYGLSSHYAQEKHGTGKKDYRASEGKVSLVDAKGPVEGVIQEILGGLRSTGTYINAHELRDFNKCGEFIRVNK